MAKIDPVSWAVFDDDTFHMVIKASQAETINNLILNLGVLLLPMNL